MKRGLSIPLLLFAALLVWTLMTPRQPLLPPAAPPQEQEERVPDSYGEAVVALEYDEAGVLLARTDADYLRRYRDDNVTELELPRREQFGDDRWRARARGGLLYERREALELRGDVQLSYPDREVEFRSEAILINYRNQTARSLAPVVAWQGESRVEAPQMLINLDTEVAVLRGGVRSVYVPQR